MPSNFARQLKKDLIMHSLQTIHTLNQQAAIDEHNKACQNALAEGSSYIAVNDELGAPDVNQKIVVFPTAASLKGHVLACIKVSDINNYTLVYGRND